MEIDARQIEGEAGELTFEPVMESEGEPAAGLILQRLYRRELTPMIK